MSTAADITGGSTTFIMHSLNNSLGLGAIQDARVKLSVMLSDVPAAQAKEKLPDTARLLNNISLAEVGIAKLQNDRNTKVIGDNYAQQSGAIRNTIDTLTEEQNKLLSDYLAVQKQQALVRNAIKETSGNLSADQLQALQKSTGAFTEAVKKYTEKYEACKDRVNQLKSEVGRYTELPTPKSQTAPVAVPSNK